MWKHDELGKFGQLEYVHDTLEETDHILLDQSLLCELVTQNLRTKWIGCKWEVFQTLNLIC